MGGVRDRPTKTLIMVICAKCSKSRRMPSQIQAVVDMDIDLDGDVDEDLEMFSTGALKK